MNETTEFVPETQSSPLCLPAHETVQATRQPSTAELLTYSNSVALVKRIQADPREKVPAMALWDYLVECGATTLSATRTVNRIARHALSQIVLREQTDRVHGDTSKGARLRTRIRSAVGRASQSAIPITVVAGDSGPVLSGEDAYCTFRGKKGREGGICQYPGAAMRAGYKIDYHRSTLAITVGAEWVAEVK